MQIKSHLFAKTTFCADVDLVDIFSMNIIETHCRIADGSGITGS